MQDIINGFGPDSTYLTLRRVGPGVVEVIVGANYENGCASYFSKLGLLELIDTLQKVADDLVDKVDKTTVIH